MRYCLTILLFLAFLNSSLAQPQVTITLITDTGVKRTNLLQFNIAQAGNSVISFNYNNFRKDGRYNNSNLYQHNERLQTGQYMTTIHLSGEKDEQVSDTLLIDSSTARVEIFLYLSATASNDFIKEVKTLIYQKEADHLQFAPIETTSPGNKAAFNITNKSQYTILSYPNPAFFFGKLHEQIGRDRWAAHYPKNIDGRFCDTTAAPHPLQSGAAATAWTPLKEHCRTYRFTRPGKYFFDLLYTLDEPYTNRQEGPTIITRRKIYRKIHEFSVYATAKA
ncbi:hypothetical protein [Paraflavitalea sp. CAU 1676]|uniref:hypothetical protein n=1 Tax=Paraflavitalea sp. CAU 1676 TaxID=3032598 RepID=UPI0023DCC661|nr:hypothetical protein [Paraflavitalea sp. CAU 1676]MDF2190391.1 hypothetical protein [Paraflavitalea sp. CAU 1676]